MRMIILPILCQLKHCSDGTNRLDQRPERNADYPVMLLLAQLAQRLLCFSALHYVYELLAGNAVVRAAAKKECMSRWMSLFYLWPRNKIMAENLYYFVYFAVTIATMGRFIEVEQRYLSGDMEEPESESFLEPDKITPTTVSLNITLLASSTLGFVACLLLILGVYKNLKFMLLPWVVAMGMETLVEIINFVYLFYLQTLNFNPITSFLFTLDFFIIVLNIYAMVCVISQFQEYLAGRGTAAFDYSDRLAAVQYTATGQHTATGTTGTASSALSGRRRSASAGRPPPSTHDPLEFSEAPSKAITSVLSRAHRSAVKKHVQFPDEASCIEEAGEGEAATTVEPEEKSESRVISSLWMELESEAAVPER